MFRFYNPNPNRKFVGDCVIRAISKLLDQSWDETYAGVSVYGFIDKDMPSSNSVWGNYLRQKGYAKRVVPDTCPICYTVKDFCRDHIYGKYLLVLDGHVVTVDNGNYYDTWDSGEKIVDYYWEQIGGN